MAMRKFVTEMKNEDRREGNQSRRVSCRTKNTLKPININSGSYGGEEVRTDMFVAVQVSKLFVFHYFSFRHCGAVGSSVNCAATENRRVNPTCTCLIFEEVRLPLPEVVVKLQILRQHQQ